MVFNLARDRNRLRRAKAAIAVLTLLLAAAPAAADSLRELFRNTVPVVVTKGGVQVERGVGLFLGSYEGKALLLTAAHVLVDLQEMGRKGSPYALQVTLLDSTMSFGYSESSLRLHTSALGDAIQHDYAIVAVPLAPERSGAIYNLTSGHFRRPDRNEGVIIYGLAPHGGYSLIVGDLVGRTGTGVVQFEVKAEKNIDQGESGSIIVDRENKVLGILSSSDGRNATGVYPGPEIAAALQTIARSKDIQPHSHGISLTVVPTYQYANVSEDLGDGVTRTSTQDGIYTSFELELFKTSRSAGDPSSSMYGLVLGYSSGGAHGLGQVDGAEYTLKYGAIFGSIDRFNNDSGQVGAYILSHKVNDKFVHRLGFSLEAIFPLWLGADTAFDAGLRMELNRFSFSSGTRNAALGFGLVLRYSWLGGGARSPGLQ